MPRWVMSSPSHMTMAVPAVIESTTSSTRGTVKLGMRSMFVRRAAEEALAAVVEHEGQAGRLHEGEGHREVAGGLGDLLLTDRALVAPLLELGDHHAAAAA